MIAVLFPRFDHDAIEERYASWQSRMLLQRGGEIEFAIYDPEEATSEASGLITSSHALVVTDPLLLAPEGLAVRLRNVLAKYPDAAAALPVSNEASNPAQRRAPPSPYLTLNELEQVTSEIQKTTTEEPKAVTWDDADPGAFLARSDLLDTITATPRHALAGQSVVISPSDYVHRWIAMRAESRDDLLAFVPVEARSMIELGCGEGALGHAVKRRQRCRVVGVELDRNAAAIARKRIDDVYQGDVEEVVSLLHEKFDCIVASEIIEHVVDPWALLADLRRISGPGGLLILSIPNLAHASIISDLLQGRFDYAYIGLTCVGHLRFFTRKSVEEMLRMTGWAVLEITAQSQTGMAADDLIARLNPSPSMKEDLTATGFYVVAQNPR